MFRSSDWWFSHSDWYGHSPEPARCEGQHLIVSSERQSLNCKCLRISKCWFLDNFRLGLYSFKFLSGPVSGDSRPMASAQ